VVWGGVTKSDKPTSKELGTFTCLVLEYVKEDDHNMVFRSRIEGTASEKPHTWEDKRGVLSIPTYTYPGRKMTGYV
jgi:hypothetical protein